MNKVNARKVSVKILCEILEEECYSNITLNKYLNKIEDTTDRGFITQLVYGTITNIYYIDYVINSYSKTKTEKMKPLILNCMRISVFQMFFLSKVPVSAICNEAVKIVKKSRYSGLASFVNGVLRNIARNKDDIKYPIKEKNVVEYLSIMYSFPEWIIKLWIDQMESLEVVEDLCKKSNEVSEISLRCNTLKINPEALYELLEKSNINCIKGEFVEECIKISKSSAIKNIKGFDKGYFQVQDQSSMLVAYAANPSEEDLVIDVCAAPGGKSTHMAQIMNNKGRIIARDVYEHKLLLIKENYERLGINNIETGMYDATKIDEKLIRKADVVLVDAPCSGLGIIRKKPDIKLNSNENIKELVEIQRQILSVTSNYVKDDGVLIYSTCTINKEENEQNVKWFTNNFDFELDSLEQYLPENLSDNLKAGYIQLYPSIHNTDGFFIARFKRKGLII